MVNRVTGSPVNNLATDSPVNSPDTASPVSNSQDTVNRSNPDMANRSNPGTVSPIRTSRNNPALRVPLVP
jgi:hypothetical protein